jgi:phospholipase/lecithinase/hemolysin
MRPSLPARASRPALRAARKRQQFSHSLRRLWPVACVAPLLGALLSPAPAVAGVASLSRLYVFGDSLSDNGNSGVISGNAASFPPIFPPPPYDGARFSNGKVAAEYLWKAFNPTGPALQASLQGGTNFAVGGATTGVQNYIEYSDFQIAPALKSAYAAKGNAWQLDQFGTPSFDPETSLFMVWMFPNDPFTFFANGGLGVGTFDGNASPAGAAAIVPTAVSNIIGTLQELAGKGARNFLVPNTPDLGLIPEFYGTGLQGFFSDLSDKFNTELALKLDDFSASRPDLDIVSFQVDDLLADVRTNPGAYGFSNVTQRCLANIAATPCSNPDSYLFWDGSHPTTAGHSLIGQRFYRATYEPVPAPLPVVGGVAALGWSRRLRRRLRLRSQKTSRSCAGQCPAG